MTDHVYQRLREHLAYLKLPAAAEELAQALSQAESQKPSYTRFLADLLSVEVSATEQRRLDGRLRFASFPQHKTIEQFDFDAQPSLDRRVVEELATLRFIEEKANVFLDRPARSCFTLLPLNHAWANSPSSSWGTSIRRPFRRPWVTSSARRSPRWT